MTERSKQVKRTIEELLAHQRDDLRLRDHLEGLRRDEAVPGLTWFWGPELYRRNRVPFLNSSTKSVEEMSAVIMQSMRLRS